MRQKLLLFIIFTMVSFTGFSQLSDLHYLPPLKQGQNNGAIQQQAVYLSTPLHNKKSIYQLLKQRHLQ